MEVFEKLSHIMSNKKWMTKYKVIKLTLGWGDSLLHEVPCETVDLLCHKVELLEIVWADASKSPAPHLLMDLFEDINLPGQDCYLATKGLSCCLHLSVPRSLLSSKTKPVLKIQEVFFGCHVATTVAKSQLKILMDSPPYIENRKWNQPIRELHLVM